MKFDAFPSEDAVERRMQFDAAMRHVLLATIALSACTSHGGGASSHCAGLAQRLETTSVDISPAFVSGAPILSPQPDGAASVAWADGAGSVHVTPLDAAGVRRGPDLVTTGSELRGFVAHDDAAGLLVVRGDAMVLVRLRVDGGADFELPLVGNNTHLNQGDAWVDSWPHEGRLAWSGADYAVYFGHTQNWGSIGNHQGDTLTLVSSAGAIDGGRWSWGCSHSLDVRLAWTGTDFAAICLSDCYPGKGIYFDHDYHVVDTDGACNGYSAGALGGIAELAGATWSSWIIPDGRPSHDVGLSRIGPDGVASAPRWLTTTDSIEERSAHLARLGSGLLTAWKTTGDDGVFAILDTNGAFTTAPAPIAVPLGDGSDFVTYPNGDAGWVSAGQSTLEVARITACP